MPNIVTHRVCFKVADGGKYVVFDVALDGTTADELIKIVNASQPMSSDFLKDALRFVDLIKEFNQKYKGLKSVAGMELGYHDPDSGYLVTFNDLSTTEKAGYTKK